MHLLALSFKAHTTLRLRELAWLAVAIGGALLVVGATVRSIGRDAGQLFGGAAIAVGGVVAILALHYGK